MKFWTKIMLAVVPALFLIACGTSGEVKDESADSAAGAGANTSAIQGVKEGQVDGTPDFDGDPLDDPKAFVSKRVVYFDFDSAAVKSSFSAIVAAHGKYLASRPDAKVTIEGHADERGTREYNIALGEQRITAVKRILKLQGASSSQINAISYGEERPASLGHDEGAWALNRRAEFIYKR